MIIVITIWSGVFSHIFWHPNFKLLNSLRNFGRFKGRSGLKKLVIPVFFLWSLNPFKRSFRHPDKEGKRKLPVWKLQIAKGVWEVLRVVSCISDRKEGMVVAATWRGEILAMASFTLIWAFFFFCSVYDRIINLNFLKNTECCSNTGSKDSSTKEILETWIWIPYLPWLTKWL